MKSLLLTCLLASIIVQLGTSQSDDTSGFPNKYVTFTLGLGPRTLDTEPGTILTSYVDDSPSMDNLSTMTIVEDKYTRVGLNIALKFGRFKGLSHEIAFDISLGEHKGGFFYYSLGYTVPMAIGNQTLLIRPAFNAGVGNFGFDVGELENNAGFIQIGEQRYNSSSLDLSLASQTFVYGPALELKFTVGDYIIFGNASYDVASNNSRPRLDFIAPSSSEEGQSTLDIDGDNPLVTFNGEKLTTLPYEASGIRMTLGFGYLWNKD